MNTRVESQTVYGSKSGGSQRSLQSGVDRISGRASCPILG